MKTRIVLAIVRFLLKAAPGYHVHRDPGRRRAENKEVERICKEAFVKTAAFLEKLNQPEEVQNERSET